MMVEIDGYRVGGGGDVALEPFPEIVCRGVEVEKVWVFEVELPEEENGKLMFPAI